MLWHDHTHERSLVHCFWPRSYSGVSIFLYNIQIPEISSVLGADLILSRPSSFCSWPLAYNNHPLMGTPCISLCQNNKCVLDCPRCSFFPVVLFVWLDVPRDIRTCRHLYYNRTYPLPFYSLV